MAAGDQFDSAFKRAVLRVLQDGGGNKMGPAPPGSQYATPVSDSTNTRRGSSVTPGAPKVNPGRPAMRDMVVPRGTVMPRVRDTGVVPSDMIGGPRAKGPISKKAVAAAKKAFGPKLKKLPKR